LEALVNKKEYDVIQTFVWEVEANAKNPIEIEDLRTYLASKTGRILYVPARLINLNLEYKFYCSYTDESGQLVKASYMFATPGEGINNLFY
jgi:hypothetical protein